jgi:hypothetical protein
LTGIQSTVGVRELILCEEIQYFRKIFGSDMIIKHFLINTIVMVNDLKIKLKDMFRMIDRGFLKIGFPLIEFL